MSNTNICAAVQTVHPAAAPTACLSQQKEEPDISCEEVWHTLTRQAFHFGNSDKWHIFVLTFLKVLTKHFVTADIQSDVCAERNLHDGMQRASAASSASVRPVNSSAESFAIIKTNN